MACDPPAFPHAPHPDLFLLAQPGRAVVRAADRQETAPRHLPLNPGPGERHSRLDRSLERTPPTLHLDQDRRRNPRTPQVISSTNSWRRTLAAPKVERGTARHANSVIALEDRVQPENQTIDSVILKGSADLRTGTL